MLGKNAKPGDTVALLISMDSHERVPQPYRDLLPKPWEEVEARLKEGFSFSIEGEARQLKVPDPARS